MCRSQADGGRRCPGSGRSAGGGGDAPRSTPASELSPELARALGADTPEGAERYERGRKLRDSGYTGPMDADGYALTGAEARMSPRQRREAAALDAMKAQMREWRSRPAPEPSPGKPMDPQLARALGCDTPEGLAKFERGRALREAGYDGPLDRDNNIPDPDAPGEQRSLGALAALSLTHA